MASVTLLGMRRRFIHVFTHHTNHDAPDLQLSAIRKGDYWVAGIFRAQLNRAAVFV
jgi:hypothetical protein